MIVLFSFFFFFTDKDSLSRFGNYIGDAESDEEVQHDQAQPRTFSFDEAFEEEEDEEPNEQQLMEVDGWYFVSGIGRLPWC